MRVRHGGSGHKLVDKMKYEAYVRYMNFDAELDAKGLLCPLPVLKARKRLQALGAGRVLRVEADDPAAIVDVPHFCNEAGHTLVSTQDLGASQVYFIRKA
jgi:tRNA 2-thiouridine synthesizing protein A